MTTTQNRLAVIFIAVSACLSAYALAHAGHAVSPVPGAVAVESQARADAAERDPSVPPASAVFAREFAPAEAPAATF
jgi:hypothetical protein